MVTAARGKFVRAPAIDAEVLRRDDDLGVYVRLDRLAHAERSHPMPEDVYAVGSPANKGETIASGRSAALKQLACPNEGLKETLLKATGSDHPSRHILQGRRGSRVVTEW